MPEVIVMAQRRFPVRITLGVPPNGLRWFRLGA
jgi:hypothetical protein